MANITIMTIWVKRIASWRDGQDTLRSSPMVSLKNSLNFKPETLEKIHFLASRF